MDIKTINPATGETIHEYQFHSSNDLNEIIDSMATASEVWSDGDINQRVSLLNNLAKLLRDSKDSLVKKITVEMGKPISESKAEIEKCAWVCDYYSENGIEFLKNETLPSDASKSYVSFRPLGIVLAIMPWNFPFWQVFRFAVPALLAGNSGLLKHAPNVTGCALLIEELFIKAGFLENVFRTIKASNQQVSKVIQNPYIKAVTLTGSTRAGKEVAAEAGRNLKKLVLELGGSDPYLILNDANLETAAEACITGRFLNNGQSCIAAKRIITVKEIYDPFKDLLTEKIKNFETGDPLDPETKLGPMAREDLRDNLHQQVRKSISRGAECILGGEIPETAGFYYPPTLLAGVRKGMAFFDEEIFGPAMALIKAENELDALSLANDSIYGLGAAVFTEDIEKGEKIAAQKLNAGSGFVNTFVRSDPRLPFGGINSSGYGRELSLFGIHEFVNIKSVYIN